MLFCLSNLCVDALDSNDVILRREKSAGGAQSREMVYSFSATIDADSDSDTGIAEAAAQPVHVDPLALGVAELPDRGTLHVRHGSTSESTSTTKRISAMASNSLAVVKKTVLRSLSGGPMGTDEKQRAPSPPAPGSKLKGFCKTLGLLKVCSATVLCSTLISRIPDNDPEYYLSKTGHLFRHVMASDARVEPSGASLSFVVAETKDNVVFCAVYGLLSWDFLRDNLSERASIPGRSGKVLKVLITLARQLPLQDLELLHARGTEIVFCGHSFGGAVATVAMLLLMSKVSQCTRLRSFTFGAPSIGDVEFMQEMKACHADQNIINFINDLDVVPLMMRDTNFVQKLLNAESEEVQALMEDACSVGEIPPQGTALWDDLAARIKNAIEEFYRMMLEDVGCLINGKGKGCISSETARFASMLMKKLYHADNPAINVPVGVHFVVNATLASVGESDVWASALKNAVVHFQKPGNHFIATKSHSLFTFEDAIMSACEHRWGEAVEKELPVPDVLPRVVSGPHPPMKMEIKPGTFFIPILTDSPPPMCGVVSSTIVNPGSRRKNEFTIRVELFGSFLGMVIPPSLSRGQGKMIALVEKQDSLEGEIVSIDLLEHTSNWIMFDFVVRTTCLSPPKSFQVNLQCRPHCRGYYLADDATHKYHLLLNQTTMGVKIIEVAPKYFADRKSRILNGSFSDLLSEIISLVLLYKCTANERFNLKVRRVIEDCLVHLSTIDTLVEQFVQSNKCTQEILSCVHAIFADSNGMTSGEIRCSVLQELLIAFKDNTTKDLLKELRKQVKEVLKSRKLSKPPALSLEPCATKIKKLFESPNSETLAALDVPTLLQSMFMNELAFVCYLGFMHHLVEETGAKFGAAEITSIAVGVTLGLPLVVAGLAIGIALGVVVGVVVVLPLTIREWIRQRDSMELMKNEAYHYRTFQYAMFRWESFLCEVIHPYPNGSSLTICEREQEILEAVEVKALWQDSQHDYWDKFFPNFRMHTSKARLQAAIVFRNVFKPLVNIRLQAAQSNMFCVCVLGQPGAGKSRILQDLFKLPWDLKTSRITPHVLSEDVVIIDFPGATDNADLKYAAVQEQMEFTKLSDMLIFVFKLDERVADINNIMRLRFPYRPVLYCLSHVDDFFNKRYADAMSSKGVLEPSETEHENACQEAIDAVHKKVEEFCAMWRVSRRDVRLICPVRYEWTKKHPAPYPQHLKKNRLVRDNKVVYEEINHVAKAGGLKDGAILELLREDLRSEILAESAASATSTPLSNTPLSNTPSSLRLGDESFGGLSGMHMSNSVSHDDLSPND